MGDLLLLSRIKAGMIPLELAPVSVAEVVAEAVQAAAPGAAAARASRWTARSRTGRRCWPTGPGWSR